MQTVLRILAIFAELLDALVKQYRQAVRDKQIDDIRKDPADSFINEFGGVRERSTKADVPGDQAGVVVDKKE